MNKKFLEKHIYEICDLLCIDVPNISYTNSGFTTDTMLARYNTSDHTIYIRSNIPNLYDAFFSIAHELRHVWQYTCYPDIYFQDYKPRSEVNFTEEYNMQLAELDANAFAYIASVDILGMKPLFSSMPESVINAIKRRILFILDEEFDY